MTRFCPVIAMILLTQVSQPAFSQNNHRYITDRISEYMSAFERCQEIAVEREEPAPSVLQKLDQFDGELIEQFLITRSSISSQECEQPELGELARAILVLEEMELESETRAAIESIKVLAFPSRNREFEMRYQELPEEVRSSLGQIEYFHEPFEPRAVQRSLEETRE